jgi:flagellar basal-body rod protein FlgB
MNVFGDRGIGTISAWFQGLSNRQQAISDNIANIDTPGYQRKEVPFETELRRALGQGSSQLAATDPRHFVAGTSRGSTNGTQAAQMLTSARRDTNNVDIDQEMVSLAETQMRYQAAATSLNKKLDTLRNILRST